MFETQFVSGTLCTVDSAVNKQVLFDFNRSRDIPNKFTYSLYTLHVLLKVIICSVRTEQVRPWAVILDMMTSLRTSVTYFLRKCLVCVHFPGLCVSQT